MAEFSELLGKTLVSIKGCEYGSESVDIECEDGSLYQMKHFQDCCESVRVEDVCGDINDVIGKPLLLAEEVSSREDPEDYTNDDVWRDSFTWTFYKLGTQNGVVTIRWLGESNGYYSEDVDFEKIV